MIVDASAEEYLKKTLLPGESLRVSVVAGGCNGYSYSFEKTKDTTGCDILGTGIVCVEKRSHLMLKNSILVYRKTDWSGILSIENPDAKSKCGCGSSFGI